MPPSEPPANEAFDCLVLRHLDGCCGEQERQELAEALRHDARKREQFTRLACQHGQLRELLISDHLLAMQPPVPRRRPPPKRTSTTWGKRHLVAAAALVAVAVTVVAVLHTASPPHATMIAGQLAVIRAGHSTPLPVGARVVAGDRLMMSGEGRAQLQLADGSALILSSAAILAVTSLDAATSGIALRLEQGSIEAEVAPQPIDHPLVIATVQSQATVVGTHFTLSCDSRASHLEVVKGIVRFRDPYSDPVLVNAGYIAESHEGRAISLHRIGEPEPPDLSVAGTGLKGDYFDSLEFRDYRFSRVDPQISFNWGALAPDPRIEPETFSIRWTGQLVARYSEEYTFWVTVDDGVRLWIDGTLLIDEWHRNEAREFHGRIQLEAGKPYPIILEYFQDPSIAQVSLSWSSDHEIKRIVPQSCLYPAP